MERILRFGRLTVIAGPPGSTDAGAEPEPGWFDPDWWRSRGAVAAELGGRAGALAVDGPAGPAVLRRYHRGGQVRHLVREHYLYTGRDRTRPFREWRVTRALFAAGLPVPEPIAAAFERRGAFYTGAILTRRIEPAVPLPEAAARMDRAGWQALGRTLVRFARAGLRHPDLNAANILVGDDGRFWLLDFDRATLAAGPTDPAPMRARLERSLAKLGIAHDPAALAAEDA